MSITEIHLVSYVHMFLQSQMIIHLVVELSPKDNSRKNLLMYKVLDLWLDKSDKLECIMNFLRVCLFFLLLLAAVLNFLIVKHCYASYCYWSDLFFEHCLLFMFWFIILVLTSIFMFKYLLDFMRGLYFLLQCYF